LLRRELGHPAEKAQGGSMLLVAITSVAVLLFADLRERRRFKA
jgi:hypothetical protein